MIHKILTTILGDPNEKFIRKLQPIVKKINTLEEEFQTLSENELRAKTSEFKERIHNGETSDDILPEAFAVLKNACRRLKGKTYQVRGNDMVWDMVPYDVQLIGGMVLHKGMVAEMKTGEGKTLVSTLAVYLNALEGKGVHVVTVNDYLAQRDAEWMSLLYEYLGLTVGINIHGKTFEEKKKAYLCDITYGTNSEFGFDYLRDNMAVRLEDCVQRTLHYAIVDEVDSILIDEARTPLIISAPAEESTAKYKKYSKLIPRLQADSHYKVDEKARTAILTDEGVKKMEELLGMENIYTEAGLEEVHHIEQALKAQTLFQKDVDYMVKNGEVVIIDQFTGRLMEGRRFSEGLHQAIEAKEDVEVKRESKTLATISLQNYFRLFKKLAGMTGTALTEAEEFEKIYRLGCISIPTNVPVIRHDMADAVYKDTNAKFLAITKRVKELHEKGQPVLIGTISVEKSEALSEMFKRSGIKHNVLNAKQHEREAEIVKDAGQKGAVTIATNMAGRGTDIKLGEGVRELGGLAVLGSERHESRRIDNQLRGRSGRQGDPGISQFYVAMTDELMRLFGGDRMQKMMEFLKVPDDMPIENSMLSRTIESAQKRVEGRNFDIRKHLVEYDDVMNKHRERIYSRRRKILESENIGEEILSLIESETKAIIMSFVETETRDEWESNHWNIDGLIEAIHSLTGVQQSPIRDTIPAILERSQLVSHIVEFVKGIYTEKRKVLDNEQLFTQIERHIALRSIDQLWMDHIDDMSKLREAVSLRGYGQRDPLIEYKSEAFEAFKKLLKSIEANTVITLFKMDMSAIAAKQMQIKPSTTETNASQVEDIEEGDREFLPGMKHETHTISSSDSQANNKHGRNDPCHCGSGKKYKKCCG